MAAPLWVVATGQPVAMAPPWCSGRPLPSYSIRMMFLITWLDCHCNFNIICFIWVFILYWFAKLLYALILFFNVSGFSSFDPSKMHVSPVIIISEFTYEEWKRDYKDSMTKEGHILVQTSPKHPALDVTGDIVMKYNQWEHINDVARDFNFDTRTLWEVAKLSISFIYFDMGSHD